MIIFNELQEKVDRIHYFVRALTDSQQIYQSICEEPPIYDHAFEYFIEDRDREWNEKLNLLYSSLLDSFGCDASQVIAILSSLDFNDEELQYWLSQEQGFSRIVQQLPTFSQKFLVIEHFRELRKSFPDKGFDEDLDYVINLAEKHAGYFS